MPSPIPTKYYGKYHIHSELETFFKCNSCRKGFEPNDHIHIVKNIGYDDDEGTWVMLHTKCKKSHKEECLEFE